MSDVECTVRAAYDYEGANDGELSFAEGDIIDVHQSNVGDGWAEGSLNGKRGYFPLAYTEKAEQEATPSAPAPAAAAPAPVAAPVAAPGPVRTAKAPPPAAAPPVAGGGDSDSDDEGGAPAAEPSVDFSNGAVDDDSVTVTESHKVTADWRWEVVSPYFSVSISSPEQKKKFGGLKKYVAYTIECPALGWKAARRYKHFDWLRAVLLKKYPLISIPALPEKALTGRYEKDFVEARRRRLVIFLDRCARHPVLRLSPALQLFCSVDNEKREKDWKKGKRAAEQDPVQGKTFFRTISCPSSAEAANGSGTIDKFKKTIGLENDILGKLDDTSNTLADQYTSMSKTLCHFSEEFNKLADTDTLGEPSLKTALQEVARANKRASANYGHQVEAEAIVQEMGRQQREIIKVTQAAFKVEASARAHLQSLKSKVKKDSPPKDQQELEATRLQTERIADVALAEIKHYGHERVVDMKGGLKAYLEQQIQFHQRLVSTYEEALRAVDGIAADENVYGGVKLTMPSPIAE